MSPLLAVAILLVSTVVVWAGSASLDSAAERLAARHRLPPAVQGALLAAVGSSFPELCTVVVSTWVHGEFDLGVAAIIGSAVFNILVIPALSGLIGGRLRFDLKLVYKDAQFYLTSIAVVLLTFSLALIHRPVGESFQGEINRPLAAVPLALYGLYLFLQQQDTEDHRSEPPSREGRGAWREWLRLLGSLVLIIVGVEGLVRVALDLGRTFEIPSFFWGATIIAAATSIPDAMVSIRAARRGGSVVSLANVLGSNIFDLLVAVPVGVMIAGTAVVDVAIATPMMAFLTLATVALFAAMRVGLSLGRPECWSFLLLYAVFVVWVGLEAVGALDLTSP